MGQKFFKMVVPMVFNGTSTIWEVTVLMALNGPIVPRK
jgi:hypothetical protein